MEFKTPFLLVLIPIVLGGLFVFVQKAKPNQILFPSLGLFNGIGETWKTQFRFIPFMFRLIACALIIIALAGPRSVLEETEVTSEGIDIILAIDSSTSMKAEDFTLNGTRQNRLEVVKNVIEEFIEQRQNDRIGLVAFAKRAYTAAPLTTDYDWLKENLKRIEFGLIEDGTAIGSSIAASVMRLKDSKAKSRVIVLLTDGVNNAGSIDPLTAAKTAEALGIKIYTIGAGTKGLAPYPVKDFFGRDRYRNVRIEIDEHLLNEVSLLTGGKYFRATDTDSLENIYNEIDRLEKTKIEHKGYKEYEELFYWPLIVAIGFICLEQILLNTLFFKIP